MAYTVIQLLLRRQITDIIFNSRTYAKAATNPGGMSALGGKKKIGKAGPTLEKRIIPAETDPEKLVNYVCGSNIMQNGEDIKLKPDNEYPEWLWTLRLGKPPPLSELEYDSVDYWKRVVKTGRKNTLNLMRNKKF